MEAFLRARNALRVARRGELVHALNHPALLAWSGDQLMGVATYLVGGGDGELLTLHARERHQGVGSALLDAVADVARQAPCRCLRVVTTNDNLDALRFYQRRGFRLTQLRPGAVTEARASLKPEIPETGSYGIALEGELELEMVL